MSKQTLKSSHIEAKMHLQTTRHYGLTLFFSNTLVKCTTRGCTAQTKGTAYVVYEDILFDAKNACVHLSGFNVCNRYLVVLYYQPYEVFMRVNRDLKGDQIDELKARYGIDLDKI